VYSSDEKVRRKRVLISADYKTAMKLSDFYKMFFMLQNTKLTADPCFKTKKQIKKTVSELQQKYTNINFTAQIGKDHHDSVDKQLKYSLLNQSNCYFTDYPPMFNESPQKLKTTQTKLFKTTSLRKPNDMLRKCKFTVAILFVMMIMKCSSRGVRAHRL